MLPRVLNVKQLFALKSKHIKTVASLCGTLLWPLNGLGYLLTGFVKNVRIEMEKYYYQYKKETGFCLEDCKIKIQRIGSMSCKECEHNRGHGTNRRGKDWIKCAVLDQALGK
jgi:hypothetical protein